MTACAGQLSNQQAAPSVAPLPDVPALLLSGRLDTRTPLENSVQLLALLPHGQLLTVAGTGHDVLDSDITGCVARALRRFAGGRRIGTPCAGRDNAVGVLARPAASIAAYRRAPGVAGDRGRVLFAALDTVVDAQVSALQALYAGYSRIQGGGLRGGRFSASPDSARLRLHRYELVAGLRVSGAVRGFGGEDAGIVTVDGPGRLDGTLRLGAKGVVTGRLGGRAVRYTPRTYGAAAYCRLRCVTATALPTTNPISAVNAIGRMTPSSLPSSAVATAMASPIAKTTIPTSGRAR